MVSRSYHPATIEIVHSDYTVPRTHIFLKTRQKIATALSGIDASQFYITKCFMYEMYCYRPEESSVATGARNERIPFTTGNKTYLRYNFND